MSSSTTELLLRIDREGADGMGSQLERQLREAVRDGRLRAGTSLPSTRDLAQQLGISRPLVSEAYAQLAAEGYFTIRQGAVPRVSADAGQTPVRSIEEEAPSSSARYDFRPGVPDLSSFPRAAWLKAAAAALADMAPDDFGYTDRHGTMALRRALADYLRRVRGAVAEPSDLLVVGGFEQARGLLFQVLAARGVRRVAVENPGYSDWRSLRAAGLTPVPVAVDDEGLDVAALDQAEVGAVLVTPAHQAPTGVVMSGARRVALTKWLDRAGAYAIEDDYDAEFRYDRAPIGALQGLAPGRVIYAGTASKTLAPALRLGWLVVPPALIEAVRERQRLIDYGCSRIEQNTLARFIEDGAYDRHLRRMRSRYGERRDALIKAVTEFIPEARIGGVAAGLHATVRLSRQLDEPAVRAAAGRHGVTLEFLTGHIMGPPDTVTTLLLSYSRLPESAIRTGVRAIAMVMESAA